ncbi:zinc finger protein 436 [Scaptodrosophila lebanonensis]|uniref:Zinc finger protein 436 n=1 Tax=Drosophila lebanonensis TaxID=7225 RepID=A0A6J2TF01_DROLE|nr:zinc finger protein 436 [Scaptodrosophila lebanonensis]
MDVEKICRTCLSLSGPFLSIYEGQNGAGTAGCLADMLQHFTKTQPRLEDNLPKKVCLSCISEINHCYSFKLKCENSNRTLHQLLPNANAWPEDTSTEEKAVQTTTTISTSREVQTDTPPAEEKSTVEASYDNDVDDEDFYDIAALGSEEPADSQTKISENIILQVEKDDMKYETEMIYNQATGELHEQTTVETLGSKQKEYKFTIFNNANGETEIAPTPSVPESVSHVTTRKGAAKLLQQQMEQQQEQAPIQIQGKRNIRRRRAANSEELQETSTTPPKQLKSTVASKVPNGTIASITTPTSVNSNVKLKYRCERCNAGFALEKSLAIHRRQNGCTNLSFKCNECERVFVSMDHLNEHQATHSSYNCTECSEVFETKEDLGRHMVQGHKRNLRNQCTVCQKVFTMLSTLRDHMRIHTGEKPFTCKTCGKSFTQNANLRQHMLRHSDIKRFKCELCPHSFVTKAELSSHARTHTGDKPYECDSCSAKFTTSCSLAKHKRKHTGERPYACDLCPLRFTALNVLKNHRRTHTGEKPYVCPYCFKSFTQRGDCQMHKRTHQGEKIYICPVCSQEFKSMEDMRSHLILHDQQEKELVHYTLLSTKENALHDDEEDADEEADEGETTQTLVL